MTAKRYKLRASAVAALAVLLCTVLAVGVNAYEPCQRIVQKYVEKVVPHHYSKATLARWAEWGKQHPDYHPPKRRPSLQPKEALEKVNFDCEVPPEPVLVAGLLTPSPIDGLAPPPQLVTMRTALPATEKTISLVDAPLNVPPAQSVETAEPQSWIFAFTGLAFLVLCWKARSRGVSSIAAAVPTL